MIFDPLKSTVLDTSCVCLDGETSIWMFSAAQTTNSFCNDTFAVSFSIREISFCNKLTLLARSDCVQLHAFCVSRMIRSRPAGKLIYLIFLMPKKDKLKICQKRISQVYTNVGMLFGVLNDLAICLKKKIVKFLKKKILKITRKLLKKN